ncbi:MAG: PAS domain-containing protein [Rhodospirillaceae bacterium]|nr:PAS domain-containing protein [Rhodospirillales bacterium]
MVKPPKSPPKSVVDTPVAALPARGGGLFPVVGVGASAGGLEALENFLAHVPAGSGMAFVIVQHLDPTRDSAMCELLQRITPMTVHEIRSHMKVKPNTVYVVPPNKDLTIVKGALHLMDLVTPRSRHLPIDLFFRSLAADQNEHAIGVILSGMGSDGSQGLRAIKEKTGLTVVQDPANAKFDSMPRSAITAGVADIVGPAEELAERILAYLQHVPAPTAIAESDLPSQTALEKITILLRESTGNDFLLYKKNTLNRRIERRMGLHKIDTLANYARYLRTNPEEIDLLFKELLIGVTNFFRDPAVWEYLTAKAIPAILAAHPAGKGLRAWVPACSTGEEAYSLAIAFKDALDLVKPNGRFSLQIYATDLDKDAIVKARQGGYPENIAADVSPERLARYFTAEGNGYRISKEIRDMVNFAPQNITTDAPFTKIDILSCRNLLIYFSPELQKKLIPLFHFCLNREGILLLGNSETVGNFTHLFAPQDDKMRLYRRIDHALTLAEVAFPKKISHEASSVAEDPQEEGQSDNMQLMVEQLLLQCYAPPAVVVNDRGDILYFSGRTGKYLEPAAGKANLNIHSMAREGLRQALTGLVRRALRQKTAIHLNNLQVGTNGGTQIVNVTVRAVEQPAGLSGKVIIVFNDVATPPAVKASRKTSTEVANSALTEEVQHLREELQMTRDEMQTSQEELKSTNEELQSTNEELQATNEELTTSKEEMQSMNEELHAVNAEMQSKVDDLLWVNNDMSNLLNSTEIVTVFLDAELRIRRFTPGATQLFKLIPSDVGRPLTDIASDLDYVQLREDTQSVLNTLVFGEKQIATHDGRWFKVRIMPYRTHDNVINGVVITFVDIGETKRLEAELLNLRASVRPEGVPQ